MCYVWDGTGRGQAGRELGSLIGGRAVPSRWGILCSPSPGGDTGWDAAHGYDPAGRMGHAGAGQWLCVLCTCWHRGLDVGASFPACSSAWSGRGWFGSGFRVPGHFATAEPDPSEVWHRCDVGVWVVWECELRGLAGMQSAQMPKALVERGDSARLEMPARRVWWLQCGDQLSLSQVPPTPV